jgi:hypothetical protein
MTSHDDDPFHECELESDAILGTHIRRRPVHRRHGDAGERVDRRDTGTFASDRRGSEGVRCEYRHRNAPNRASGFRREADRNPKKPYTAAAFFHFKATGSFERHRAYHAAYGSDAFTVDFESDYESGDLTITVEEVTGPHAVL